MRTTAALAFLLCAATPALAHANESTKPKPASESARWYGWQIAISDAAGLTLAIAGSREDNDPLFYSGIGAYLVVPPVIHALHDRGGAFAGSLAFRALLPAVVALATFDGSDEDGGDGDGDGNNEFADNSSLLTMMLIVSAVDIAFLSWKSPPRRAITRLDPVVWFSADRAAVGAVGRF